MAEVRVRFPLGAFCWRIVTSSLRVDYMIAHGIYPLGCKDRLELRYILPRRAEGAWMSRACVRRESFTRIHDKRFRCQPYLIHWSSEPGTYRTASFWPR